MPNQPAPTFPAITAATSSCLSSRISSARRWLIIFSAIASTISPSTLLIAADPTSSFTQAPEVVASVDQNGKVTEQANQKKDAFDGCPESLWIWGANPNEKYHLVYSFNVAGAAQGRARYSCDNVGTLKINGQNVSSSSEWQQPPEVDLTPHLKPGMNEIVAEVANEGGAAAFLAQVALVHADGTKQFITTNGEWKAIKAGDPNDSAAARVIGKLGDGPWGDVFTEGESDPLKGAFLTLTDYQVERLYTVPKDELGSWVAITVDPQGRLIVSDQGDKGLCRITPSPIGSQEPTRVEKIPVAITSAQGLLCAFDSLYVSVNGKDSGLYRIRDTNRDDQWDEVTKLHSFGGAGEHGPHALRLSPDGQRIVVICGNHTKPPFPPESAASHPEYRSRIPMNWNEDHILPRQWDANGHAVGILAPGGWIAQTDPEGKSWEVLSMGYRNPYDMDYNTEGELFAYDADMEWDFGTPWYRPTRVVHATSGSEFGWRSGTGKWPSYYQDSLPPAVDIGPGSPVGVSFGYGAKFPSRYQRALFICDWTFGTMYAIHLEPKGSTYTAKKEEFLSRTPLPLTDVAIGHDGAMYFTIGGRGTQSELFRVTYRGKESTTPATQAADSFAALRQQRREIERWHSAPMDELLAKSETLVPQLVNAMGHEDRFIRYAARVAIERLPVDRWKTAVLNAKKPWQILTGSIGLAHQGNPELQASIIDALLKLDVNQLDIEAALAWHRAVQLACIRLGYPSDSVRQQLLAKLDPIYPIQVPESVAQSNVAWVYDAGLAPQEALNRELINILVYLRSPEVVRETIPLLDRPAKQLGGAMDELLARNRGYGKSVAGMMKNQPDLQQVHYAFVLRNAKEVWTTPERLSYFRWYQKAHQWTGGASYQKFLDNMAKDAYENATDVDRLAIEAAGLREPYQAPELPQPIGPGRKWTVDEIVKIAGTELKGRDYEAGKKAYAAARCVVCHRFVGEGGATGPDLTQVAGRFGIKDLSDAIVNPSRIISDQYRATRLLTSAGQVVTGRLLHEDEKEVRMLTDPESSSKVQTFPRDDVESLEPSPLSLMPAELIDKLNDEEVLDLMAFLLSRGDADNPMFVKKKK